ncbi:MAG: hypothetical protein ACTHKU_15195 [Verrucomicrobiota bacterium]
MHAPDPLSTPALSVPPTDSTCELCGCFDAVEIGDRRLCVDCYGNCGACCQVSGLD